ncbi:MAG TPA: hypothetical protein VJY54_11180 [Lachnospiraceae bacterium]|nr:hypothetical protein [Lachnospiraceae bacterium]
MNLLGQVVVHNKFGNGVISDLSENKITVSFEESQKLFLYPDAFMQFLTLKNNNLQKEFEKLKEECIRIDEEKKVVVERDNYYRRRFYAMKVLEKSQVAFDISSKEVQNASHMEFIETGCYLTGNRKGMPRIPSNMQPNSAAILTSCDGSKEDKRRIVGVAMVDDRFWGDECEDGKVWLHKDHKLVLPQDTDLSFWRYFTQDVYVKQWGRIPFKYFQNETIQKMIHDICHMLLGTEQEDKAIDFYNYYASINHLSGVPSMTRSESKNLDEK